MTSIRTPSAGALLDLVGRNPRPGDRDALEFLAKGARSESIAHLSDALRQRGEWLDQPFRSLLPGLDRVEGPPPWHRVGTRSANVLRRAEVHQWGQLAAITPFQLWLLPNLGAGSFAEIMRAALAAWADLHLTGGPAPETDTSPPDQPNSRSEHPEAAAIHETRARSEANGLLADAERIFRAMWLDLGASTLAEGLARWSADAVPVEAAAAFDRVRALDIAAFIGAGDPDEDAWRSLLTWDARDALILRERIFPSDRPTTLRDLGDRLRVTQERVRQLEGQIRPRLHDRLRSDRKAVAISHLAAWVRQRIGDVATTGSVEQLIETAVADTSASGADPFELELRHRVLRKLAGPHKLESGLLLTKRASGRIARLRDEVLALSVGTVVEPDRVESLMDDLGVTWDLRPTVIEMLGLRDFDGKHVRWRGSLADKAVAALTVAGRPISMIEIHEMVGFDANPRSLSAQVQGDLRLMRRGKDRYGLREWGGEEYSGILEELEQAIERDEKGRVSLERLVREFASEFGVSQNSVRTYAKDRRFVLHPDGCLALRGPDDPEVAISWASVELTRGAYRIEGVWHARFAVDEDLLRGSGHVIRRGIAFAAGLEPDLTFGVEFGPDTVTFSWSGSQPQLGSLRGLAAGRGCVEGDFLFVPLSGAEPRSPRRVSGHALAHAHGLVRLAREMGIDEDGPNDDLTSAIAGGLGLPLGADLHDVVDRLRDRGETDLVDLVPEEWR